MVHEWPKMPRSAVRSLLLLIWAFGGGFYFFGQDSEWAVWLPQQFWDYDNSDFLQPAGQGAGVGGFAGVPLAEHVESLMN